MEKSVRSGVDPTYQHWNAHGSSCRCTHHNNSGRLALPSPSGL